MSETAQTTTTTTTSDAVGAGADALKTDVTSMMSGAADGAAQTSDATGEAKADAKTPPGGDKPYSIEIPEKYAQFVDKAALEGFAKLAKEAGVTLEQANKIAAFDLERRAAQVTADQKASDEMVAKQSATWFDEIKKDPEFGGDKFAATQNNVLRAFAKFGDAALSQELVKLGMDNHPGLVRMIAKVGAALGEDSGSIKGAGSAKAKRDWIY